MNSNKRIFKLNVNGLSPFIVNDLPMVIDLSKIIRITPPCGYDNNYSRLSFTVYTRGRCENFSLGGSESERVIEAYKEIVAAWEKYCEEET